MTIDTVREYYGRVLTGTQDLKTSACCSPAKAPPSLAAALANVHEEVRARYYGCGFVAPEQLTGARVLDLGCGAGQDVYVLAQLVGAKGEVVGVDMTPEQLAVARTHESWHAKRFGYGKSNVRFLDGYIEQLDRLDLEPGSFDVIVSNCVINLSPDKTAVLAGAKRLLKPGGELYFADVYADRRLPDAVKSDPVLLGECLGGALYWGDFQALARTAGFGDPRLVTSRPLTVDDAELAAKTGPARFFSATYRLFNIDALEPACEDYGQAVVYKGTVAGHPDRFDLDGHHPIETGRVFPVCGNTWRMLAETRFKSHFSFIGSFDRHYGIFPGCGSTLPFATGDAVARPVKAGCC